ncbi:hypothetical protein ABT09_02565 [bacterium SCN 57-13]|nr:MAG: hypothetical protein ABT09_02565 [bacterium SCN 57-13]
MPVYLNEQAVLDLIAVMEDGFARISTQTSVNSQNSEGKANISGSIGSKFFSFLNLGVDTDIANTREVQNAETRSIERTHTATSLFIRLRRLLSSSKNLKRVSIPADLKTLRAGEFIEIEANLKKNPMLDALESLMHLKEIFVFAKLANTPLIDTDEDGNVRILSNDERIASAFGETIPLFEMLDSIVNALRLSGSIELFGITSGGVNSVLSTEQSLFSIKDPYGIVDGQYRIMGKVTQVLHRDSEQKINLLRRTGFSKVNGDILLPLVNGLTDLSKDGFDVGKIIVEVEGPAIQITPICIYV